MCMSLKKCWREVEEGGWELSQGETTDEKDVPDDTTPMKDHPGERPLS